MKKFLIALVVVFMGSMSMAQEKGSSNLWIEGGLSYTSDNPNAYLGLNKRFSDHASFGIMLSADHLKGTVSAFNNHGGIFEKKSLAVTPNIGFNYPISSRISWTPRAYLSVGFGRTEEHTFSSTNTTGTFDSYLETKEIPFELGFKLFSFDFNINTRCAINLTLDALSPYISSGYSLDQNKMEDIRVNLPFGKIRLAEQATMTIGFRWKF